MSLVGHYISGCGQAHRHTDDLWAYFNCPVHGTFNVRTDRDIRDYRSCIDDTENGRRFWLVKLNGRHYAWAYRWAASKQAGTTWELVSKALLPDSLKEGAIQLEVCERLSDTEISEWAAQQYWFQSFPWGPQRADTGLVWDNIRWRAEWSRKTVLDIGCNAGAYAFRASKCGAQVVGFDTDYRPLETARFINDKIEMQDVQFMDADPLGTFDIILYLSVHHQRDKAYRMLPETLKELQLRAKAHLFAELIVPDLAGRLTVPMINEVAGTPILSYRHKVRGIRNLYHLKGEAQCN